MQPTKTYFPQLDGLRFFAFLVVFIHHAPAIPFIPGWTVIGKIGWLGVDLFLCLSAFLFVHLLRAEFEQTGTIKIIFFYLRRALRIWPAYAVAICLVIVLNLWEKGWPGLDFWRIAGLATFTDNLVSAVKGYNPLAGSQHLWTLSYEEQFYLFIPLFLRFIFPRRLKVQIQTVLFLLGLGFIARAAFIGISVPHPAIWVLPFTHFESILLGLLIGLGAYDRLLQPVPAWLLGAAGLLLCGFTALLPDIRVISWHLMLLYPLVGLGTSLLVFAVLRHGQSRGYRWLGWSPLAYLGKISYGLYLYHYILFEVVNYTIKTTGLNLGVYQNPLVFVIVLAVTILLAAISYKMVEKPFLRLKNRFTLVASRPL